MGNSISRREIIDVGIYLLGVACLALAMSWFFWRAASSSGKFRQRCNTELSRLLQQLERRHLVMSHLMDALDSWPDVDDQAIRASCDQAADAIGELDRQTPETRQLYRIAVCERDVAGWAQELLDGLGEYDSDDRVIACRDGLVDINREITETTSAYNSAVITYLGYLDSHPLIVRKFSGSTGHCVLDLDPPHSSDSSSDPPIRTAQ